MINVDKLQELMELYKKLYSQLEPLKKGDEFDEIEDSLVQDFRKLTIAQMIQKKYTICITGLQGAGKSTLMQNFYDLPEDALTVSIGTGEKIPVFITEKKDINKAQYYVTELIEKKDKSGFFDVEQREIDRKEFLSQSGELTESSRVMYLEVYVPFKHTYDEEVSFILMPGYERNQLNYWKDLIDFSVNSSDVAVFVSNYTISTRAENDLLLKRIKQTFSSHTMICALTGTDIQYENTMAAKEQIKEMFNLSEDKVICTGSFCDENKNTEWKNKLKDAIQNNICDNNRKHLQEMLRDIQTSMRLSLNNLKDLVDENIRLEHLDNEVDDFIKQFEIKKKSLKKGIQRNLKKELDEAKQKSLQKYESKKADTENMGKEFLNKFKRVFISDSVRDIVKTKNEIEQSLYDKDNIPYSSIAIVNSFLEDRTENKTLEYLLEDQNGKTSNGKPVLNIGHKENLVKDLQLCLDDSYNTELAEFCEKDSIMPMVCEISTYYFAKNIMSSMDKKYVDFKAKTNDKVMSNIDLLKGMEDTKKLGLGVFAMAGIDILPDGKLDALSGIAGTIGISTTAMAGIVAAVMVISLGITLGRDINKLSRKELEYAESCIIDYYDSVYENFLTEYDDAMELVEQQIVRNLKRLFGYGKNEMTLYNLKITLNNIDKKMVELFREINSENKQWKIDYVFNN